MSNTSKDSNSVSLLTLGTVIWANTRQTLTTLLNDLRPIKQLSWTNSEKAFFPGLVIDTFFQKGSST